MADQGSAGVPDRLREAMSDRGMTIDAFAELLGEKPQRVKDVLRGKQRAPEALLAAMQRQGFDVGYVLTGIRSSSAGMPKVAAMDVQLLKVCIEGLEEALALRKATMAADKKAELIVKLYDLHAAAASPPRKATILQFMKHAA